MKERMKERKQEKQLKKMDRQWERSGAGGWEVLPPSAYATHTPEEIDQMKESRMKEVEALLEQLP